MKYSRHIFYIQIIMAICLSFNILYWFSVRDVRAKWGNVPPAPDTKFIGAMGLGDASLAYRLNAIMIQNFGDTGGRYTPLKDYDYDRLSKWFFLQNKLDPRSNFIPYLAAYYFSGVQEPDKFYPVLDYLEMVGVRSGGENWRWLAQAVYVSRFVMDDLDKALELAKKLADTAPDDAPAWVRQMPVFVMKASGDKEAAYALMLEILKSNVEKMHPSEVNAARAYICDQILTENQKAKDPLCEGVY